VLDAHESNTSPAAGNVDVAQVLTVLTDELGIDASPEVGWVPPDEDVVVF
jgi:hypothetical protein